MAPMESLELRICRFCFSSSNPLIDIFAESEVHILDVIHEHIGEVHSTVIRANIHQIL